MAPDGSLFYVAGYNSIAGNGQDFLTVAYDTLTGAQAWEATFDPGSTGLHRDDRP